MGSGTDGVQAVGVARRKRLLIIATIALVVIAGGVAAWKIIAAPESDKPASGNNQPADRPKPSPAQAATAKGDYEAAARALEAEGRTDMQSRVELAVAYENAKQYDKALAVYADLDKAGQLTANFTFRAGEVAFAKKDMATAKRYYELAKERYQKEGGHRIQAKLKRCDDRLAEVAKAGA